MGAVETWKSSPAPSQSLVVRTGVLTRKKPRSLKNWWIPNEAALLTRSTAPIRLDLGRRCAISRRNSGECFFFWSGYWG